MKTKETFVSTIILAIAMIAMLSVIAQAEILMDYDDGIANSVHDAAVRDGDFSNTTVVGDVDATYADMPNWYNIDKWDAGQDDVTATKTGLASGVGSDRNIILATAPTPAQTLEYIPTGGETYYVSYMWLDTESWVGSCTVNVFLYTTPTDVMRNTTRNDLVNCESLISQVDEEYQTETFTGEITLPPESVGKNLFLRIDSVDQTTGFGRLDNLYVEILHASPATIVSPAHREIDVPFGGTLLEWTVDENWACDMYIGSDPCALSLELEDYAGVGGAYSFDTGALDPSTTYYWQVDAIDPNGDVRIPGPAWVFRTADPIPAIDADPNAYEVVYAGEDAAYSIVAHNPGTGDTTGLTYQWYKYVDGISDTALSDGADYAGTTTVEMTVLAADVADEGAYYCVVTLGTGTAQTLSGLLGIKAMEAHWTMDQADYVGGLYLDISGNGNDADPNGEWVPTFTTGADGTTATGAVTIDPATGWAQAGTWDPSENTGSLTVSAWINWAATTGDTSAIAAKHDGWNEDNTWLISLNNAGGLWLSSEPSGWTVDAADIIDAGIEGGIVPDEWFHVCVTINWDGSAAVYVNGILIETDDEFMLGSKTDATVIVGAQHYAPLERSFDGSLDDIRIYNYALTPEEVAADYYATSGIGICLNESLLDLTGPEGEPDCVVDIYDFALTANEWLDCGLQPAEYCP